MKELKVSVTHENPYGVADGSFGISSHRGRLQPVGWEFQIQEDLQNPDNITEQSQKVTTSPIIKRMVNNLAQ